MVLRRKRFIYFDKRVQPRKYRRPHIKYIKKIKIFKRLVKVRVKLEHLQIYNKVSHGDLRRKKIKKKRV